MKDKKLNKSNWTWWDEIKYRTEELSYPIATLTVLIVQVILAITYILVIIIAIAMVISSLLNLF